MLEAVAAFTRCFNALDAHVEMSAVLSAPPPRTMTARRLGHLGRAVSSTHGRAAAAAAPAERVALCDGVPVRPAPSLDARRSRSVRRETPRAPGTARRRLRAAALALLDALSERPAVLFAALPSDDRHHLLALLARRLEHSATAVRLSPSGRVRAADAHSAVGMLRRLTLSGGDQDGATYAWMMGALLAEVAPVTARSVGAHYDAPTTARMCASLPRLALIGAASAPQQRAHLDARKPDLHRHTPRAWAPCWARRAAACTERPAALKMARSIACSGAPCSP